MFGRSHSPETKALMSENYARWILGKTHFQRLKL